MSTLYRPKYNTCHCRSVVNKNVKMKEDTDSLYQDYSREIESLSPPRPALDCTGASSTIQCRPTVYYEADYSPGAR